jgi:molecular chaperone DnaK
VTENVTVTGAVVMGLSGRVEVSLELDAEGTLVVTAEDESSAGLPWNNKQEMVVTSGNRLSQESIHRMREQAEEFADEDARWREAAIALDEFESYVYGVKNALKDEGISAEVSDHGRKIVLGEVKKAKAFVKENRALLKASKGEFEEAQRAMEKVVAPIMSKMQRATLPSGDSSGRDGGRSDGKEEL